MTSKRSVVTMGTHLGGVPDRSAGGTEFGLCMLSRMHDVPALLLARVADDLAVGREIRARMMRRLATAVERHAEQAGGRCVVAPVEGSLAVFDAHEQALACAVALRESREVMTLRPRIAVHAGRVESVDSKGGEVWTDGPAVHQAARLASVVRAGQVVVSSVVAGRPPGEWSRDDTGHHELVGLMGQVRLDRLRAPGEEPDWMPPVRSQEVLGGNLVPDELGIVGRDADLVALTELLELGARVITVVSEPGVGASRLCREVALTSRGTAGSVWWCDARNGALIEVIRAVGDALGVPLVLGRTDEACLVQVGHALAARSVDLLVLNGLDALGGEAARVIETWGGSAPNCRFLVHSPRPLRVRGEVVYRLRPLPEGESVRLLGEAVRRAGGTPLDTSLARGLVRTLERNPFALGLVAPLTKKVAPAELVVRLRSQTGGPFRVLGLVWSHLDVEARAVLQACAVFPIAFDIPSLVGTLERAKDPTATLRRLEQAGLLRVRPEAQSAGVLRYGMDRRVRSFVLGRLQPERRRRLFQRFAECVLQSAEVWAERAWDRDGAEVLARLDAAREELLTIARWGLSDPEGKRDALGFATRAIAALQPLFLMRGPFPQQRALLDQALEQCATFPDLEPARQVKLLLARVDARRLQGRSAHAWTDLARATSIADRASDDISRVRCLFARGTLAFETEDRVSAATAFSRSMRLARELDRRREAALAASSLGVVRLVEGQPVEAETTLRRALDELRDLGTLHFQGIAVGNLGAALRAQERFDEARVAFREAIGLHRETGERRLEALRLADLGALEMQVGRLDDARTWWEDAVVLAREVGDRSGEAAGLEALGLVSVELGETQMARARLFEALAVRRLARDSAGEGASLGNLGVVEHCSGLLEPAREAYRAALPLLRAADDGARVGLFSGWLGALEAETGMTLAARAHFDEAQQLLRASAPEHLPLLWRLEASRDLMWAKRVPSDRGTYVAAARRRLDRQFVGQGLEARLAHVRLHRLLDHIESEDE